MDIAEGLVATISYIQRHMGWRAINLGCGHGYSVLDLVNGFGKGNWRAHPKLSSHHIGMAMLLKVGAIRLWRERAWMENNSGS